MKRFVILLIAGLSLISAAGCGRGGDATQTNQALSEMVEGRWNAYTSTLEESAGGMAIYVATPRGNFFAAASEMEGATPETHFRAASNTKTFTAASIMLLHQEGALNIEDLITAPIPGRSEAYVPETPGYDIPYKDQITIRQLLSHRAGVYDIGNLPVPKDCDAPYAGGFYTNYVRQGLGEPNHQFTFDELIGVVAHCQISLFAPGQDYHYSNTGYSILGKIIERVSGLGYSEFVTERLLRPNGLSKTSVPHLALDQSLPDPYAPGFYIAQGNLAEHTEDNMSENVAEGNIISTQTDLAHWISALLRGEAGLSSETVSMMMECATERETGCYGLGLSQLASPDLGWGHTGAHMGYLSLMIHDPVRDITITAFTNLLNFDDIYTEMDLLNQTAVEARTILGY